MKESHGSMHLRGEHAKGLKAGQKVKMTVHGTVSDAGSSMDDEMYAMPTRPGEDMKKKKKSKPHHHASIQIHRVKANDDPDAPDNEGNEGEI